MGRKDDEQDAVILEFRRRLQGMGQAELQELSMQVLELAGKRVRAAARPDLRRPPLDAIHMLRIRASLDHSDPLIWRELDVRSDVTLDVLHMVMQGAFGWADSHLHRFSAGGHAFDAASQIFLCPYDEEDPDLDEVGGIPAREVRVDELLQEPGDTLAYLYDYGDSWEVTITLVAVAAAPADAPEAVAIAGERAAPPEDSGGGVDLAALSLVVEDPARFELDEVQQALRSEILHGSLGNLDGRLSELGMRLLGTSLDDELHAAVLRAAHGRFRLDDDEVLAALRAHRWFLDRAADGGIPLTSAGYLRPADVEAAAAVVPTMVGWIGKNNRENHAHPLHEFRLSLQRLGLLRKYKGSLLLTRRGELARRDPQALWRAVASGCVEPGDNFDAHATLLILTFAASSEQQPLPIHRIVAVLRALGWHLSGGGQVERYDLVGLPVLDTLSNVTSAPTDPRSGPLSRVISPEAAALARAALRSTR